MIYCVLMQKRLSPWFWLLPLLLQSGDALAWGLYTHVYFAQLLVWAIPLLDPRFQRAAKIFPQLVMAGACLPDLALVGKYAGTDAFNDTHHWHTANALLKSARADEELALAIGFSSHLLVDVIAHNHFVPAHETMWIELPMVTHVVSEWAMDAHVAPHLFDAPSRLLERQSEILTIYVAQQFGCSQSQAKNALRKLARADRGLRMSRIPQALYHSAGWIDVRLRKRFDYYIDETGVRLHQINRVLQGEAPSWSAELQCEETKRTRMKSHSRREIKYRLPLPRDLFGGS